MCAFEGERVNGPGRVACSFSWFASRVLSFFLPLAKDHEISHQQHIIISLLPYVKFDDLSYNMTTTLNTSPTLRSKNLSIPLMKASWTQDRISLPRSHRDLPPSLNLRLDSNPDHMVHDGINFHASAPLDQGHRLPECRYAQNRLQHEGVC